MRGIGDQLNKNTKIKILQLRANLYNEQFDKHEEEGLNPDQIRGLMTQKEYESRHTDDKDRVLPFDESRHVIRVSGGTDFGFDKSHKGLTATKQFYEPARQKFEAKKALQKTGRPDPEDELNKKYKQQECMMIEKIYEDHIHDLLSGDTNNPNKKPGQKSNYGQNYTFDTDFQKECDNQDFTYHQMKNDLKWYSEAYAKYKGTLRK